VLGERERERVQREEAQQRQEGRPGGGQQGWQDRGGRGRMMAYLWTWSASSIHPHHHTLLCWQLATTHTASSLQLTEDDTWRTALTRSTCTRTLAPLIELEGAGYKWIDSQAHLSETHRALSSSSSLLVLPDPLHKCKSSACKGQANRAAAEFRER
jgi:hypothetical protein